jgi:hypothetical protein
VHAADIVRVLAFIATNEVNITSLEAAISFNYTAAALLHALLLAPEYNIANVILAEAITWDSGARTRDYLESQYLSWVYGGLQHYDISDVAASLTAVSQSPPGMLLLAPKDAAGIPLSEGAANASWSFASDQFKQAGIRFEIETAASYPLMRADITKSILTFLGIKSRVRGAMRGNLLLSARVAHCVLCQEPRERPVDVEDAEASEAIVIHSVNKWFLHMHGHQAIAEVLVTQLNHAMDSRDSKVAAFKTLADWDTYRDYVRGRWAALFAPLPSPSRSPPVPTITETIVMEDYDIQLLYYEPRPGFYATGALWLPKGVAKSDQKVPGIVFASGHAIDGWRGHSEETPFFPRKVGYQCAFVSFGCVSRKCTLGSLSRKSHMCSG